ncbi:hypothetical protein ACU6DI_003225 [Vibrio navarrensis]|nr:hypothetical protein [Vibrio navarrensis]
MKTARTRGLATLLVTALLLIVVLLVTLGASKTLLYQIKRAQNEVKARQDFWQAEGGLECAFSKIKEGVIVLTNATHHVVNGCNSAVVISKKNDNEYLVTSTKGYAQLNKMILTFGLGLGATIKTSAAIELTGSMHFVPLATGDIDSSICTSIISGGTVSYIPSPTGKDEHFLTVDSSHSSHASGALGAPSFTCKPTHKSNLYDPSRSPTYAGSGSKKGQDILENVANISVFQDLFSKPLNESNMKALKAEIQSDPEGLVIDSNTVSYTPGGWVYACDNKIEAAYKQGKRRFWIEGSCAISGSVFGSSTQSVNDSSQLLIINGVLYTKSMGYFDGLIYQYVPPSLNVKTVWADLFTSSANIGVSPTSFQRHDVDSGVLDNFTFLLDGSMKLDGGIGMDTQGRTIRLNGSLIPSYNREKTQKYLSVLEWQKGSWHGQ